MLSLHRQRVKPAEAFAAFDALSAADRLSIAAVAPLVVVLQEHPDIALIAETGIVLPPHERWMLYQMHRGAGTNVTVASRGTSKSSTECVLYQTYKNAHFSRRNSITLSATGFRGGQSVFIDTERWLRGGWDSQDSGVSILRACVSRPSIVMKGQTHWSIDYDSLSNARTLPTKDLDAIRGQRANDLYIDEANTTSRELIDTVAMPFLNVKGDFRHGGVHSLGNQVYYTTTVDFGWRAFQDRVRAAKEGLERDLLALHAAQRGEWDRFAALDREGLHRYTYTQFDYTDLLIRNELTTRDGRRFRVHWPNKDHELVDDPRGIPFVERDGRGYMMREGRALSYYPTYPVEKEMLEQGLLDGSADTGSWLAEQRNIVDTAVGDVYSNELVDTASCIGERCIVPFEQLPETWRRLHSEDKADYAAPVMWRCTDPCVLGVDYAPQSDFCAFVVIRLGPLASGEFDPLTGLGKTRWSSVVWAEQHLRMSGPEAAGKIRELMERYNLHAVYEPHVLDTWQACRAVGLDMRGGGSAVRDSLSILDDAALRAGLVRIYDPLDTDERIAAFKDDPAALPLLDGIWPSDQLNDRLVEYTVAQMQQGMLYIGKYLDVTQRPPHRPELAVGYNGCRALDYQLRKLRQAPTKNYRSFYMEGNTTQAQNKKDLWAAFVYAAKQMRAHILRKQRADNTPPPMAAAVTRVGSGLRRYPYGHVPGTRG